MADEAKHEDLALVGGYTLNLLEIKTHSNNSIYLNGRFAEINIYESILSPVILGDILIEETYNFVSFGPIVGGEELTFVCSNIPAGNKRTTERKTKFVVYTVEEKVYKKDRMGSYLIRFCSKEAIYNQQIRICSTIYKKTFTEIALDVNYSFWEEVNRQYMTKLENMSAVERRNSTNEYLKFLRIGDDENEQKISIHFPNLHPFECLSLLAGRACLKPGSDKDHGNPFFFFEQLDNSFVFMSWSELVKKFDYSKELSEHGIPKDLTIPLLSTTDKRNKYVFMSLPSIWGAESKALLQFDWFRGFENFVTVEYHKFQKDFDFFENISRGVYASTLVSFDNCSKKIVQHSWSNKHLCDKACRIYSPKENTLNVFNDKDEEVDPASESPGKRKSEYFSPIKYDSYIKSAPTHDNILLKGVNDFCPELTKNMRMLKLQELNNNVLHVNIPGNLNFTVGTFTDVFMHSHDETITDTARRDPHFAGTYLNLSVRHCFKDDGRFFTALELAKDSFIDKTLQTFPRPKKEGR